MNGIFQGLYDLIATYIYGGAVEVGSYYDLCAILIATLGSLFVVAIPFIVVGLVVKMLFDCWTNFISGGR